MSIFRLSLSTQCVADHHTAAIDSTMAILQRDMRDCLRDYCGQNVIRLSRKMKMAEEAYCVRISEDEIVVEYADDLGAVFGLLSISGRFLDIQPMDWWNDREPKRRNHVDIPFQTYCAPEYAVRYRGWFINDEVLLDGWKPSGRERTEMWRRVFETVLRCGGNMIIPGTDRAGEGLDLMASNMGLILTQHHAELLGAEMFGRVWPDLPGSYRLYPDKFEWLWRRAAEKYKGRKVIYAIGFRAQSDVPFWEEDKSFDTPQKRGEEIERIMRRQMEIVREVTPDALFCTNLYGEMMRLYREGCLHIPDGVFKVWADNGYGRMVSRRQGLDNPRVDAMPRGEGGSNGIYYHAGFFDLQAANHITQLQVPVENVVHELDEVLRNGAKAYWIINSGSVKPHVYILDLMQHLWLAGEVDITSHARAYARRYFGDERVGELLTGYADCSVKYGAHWDERAGDQYYHYAIREAAYRMIRGEWGTSQNLLWAESGDLLKQMDGLATRCADAVPSWEDFRTKCKAVEASLQESGARLLSETLEMNATVHLTGCRCVISLAKAAHCLKAGDIPQAFYRVGEALGEARLSYEALRGAENAKWVGYYQNDCFTNLGLTCDVLFAFRAWLRMIGDGPYFWGWERAFTMKPEDARVLLQTIRFRQFSDDSMYAAMKTTEAYSTDGKGRVSNALIDAMHDIVPSISTNPTES